MLPSLRRWFYRRYALPTATAARPRFRPHLHALDDRITPSVSFGNEANAAAGTGASGEMAVGDFNGDGRQDIAVLKTSDDSVAVLLNTTPAGASTPTFAAASSFAVSSGPVSLAAGDFNGDGRTDLVALSRVYSTATANVLRNTTAAGAGAAAFASALTFSVGNNATAVRTGDINADGRTDFVTVNGATATVRLNTTAAGATLPTFAGSQSVTVGSSYQSNLAVTDLDGDGRDDLAVVDYAGSVRVLMNATNPGASAPLFGTATAFLVGSAPYAIAAGDFDGDGRRDLIAVNSTGNSVSVLRNAMAAGDTSPSFDAARNFTVGTSPDAVTVADFSGDGRPDFVTTNSSYNNTTATVRENTTPAGDSTVSFAAPVTFASGNGPTAVASGDFTGDGRPDLAVANGNIAGVSLRPNVTGGTVVSTPALVGQFGNAGVWAFNRATGNWAQLTAVNADLLATAPNGNAVANFGGNGVWYYRPTTGWVRINTASATALAIDGLGNAYGSFAGVGTSVYRLHNNSWGTLTSAVADRLAASESGWVVANFGANGVSRFLPATGWLSLATPSAGALAIGEDGTIAASFAGFGVYRHKAGAWARINTNAATQLAVGAGGSVAAVFPGFGVAKYIPYAGGWQSLTNNGAGVSLAVDLFGNVFTSFTGGGVWEFSAAYGWRQRTVSDASRIALGR